MAGLSALVLVVVLLGWFSAGSSFFVPVVVVGVPVALVAILGVRRFNVDYLRASTGVRAEARVARVLGRSACVAVVHGALLDRGDVDHVVLGPALAVIETKHGRGQISFDGGGSLRVGGRRLPRDPLAQARANSGQPRSTMMIDSGIVKTTMPIASIQALVRLDRREEMKSMRT